MQPNDVPAVLKLIETNDEDEAEWAAEMYGHGGHRGQFVITHQQRIAGVSGYALADGTDNAYWIAWTFLNAASRRQSLGATLLERILRELKTLEARKVFVSTSNRDTVHAVALYEAAGFQLEVETPDFYEPGEAQLIYGLTLAPDRTPPSAFTNRQAIAIALSDLYLTDGTEDCAGLDWDFSESGQSFTATDLVSKLDEARADGASRLIVSFASDLTQALPILDQCQLHETARLRDFWAGGIDDVRYEIKLI